MFVKSVIKFPPGISEITDSQEGEGHKVTYNHQNNDVHAH